MGDTDCDQRLSAALRSTISFRQSADKASSDTITSHSCPVLVLVERICGYPHALTNSSLGIRQHRGLRTCNYALSRRLSAASLLYCLPRPVSHTLLLDSCSRVMWSKSIGPRLEVSC